MSISPIITFKAGICDADVSTGRAIAQSNLLMSVQSEVSPPRIKPVATKGFLYLYSEDGMLDRKIIGKAGLTSTRSHPLLLASKRGFT